MKKLSAIALLLALSFAFAAQAARATNPAPDAKAAIGAVVPDFTLPDADGKEHSLASLKGKAGTAWTSLKFFVAWLILFGSKFVILEALTLVFGDSVRFEGLWHGIIWLIAVAVTMVIVEELTVRVYRKLA
jgi:opacity protein-like surface antigen